MLNETGLILFKYLCVLTMKMNMQQWLCSKGEKAMRSSNIKPLKACPMCSIHNVFASYEENARYRYECKSCGQYFEFNAPSQAAADVIFNYVICGNMEEGADDGNKTD
jgi:transcription elongation factor Elf1